MTQLVLEGQLSLRLLEIADAKQVAESYQRNRKHLEPWEPARPAEFFTEARQAAILAATSEARRSGLAFPFGLFERDALIGRFNISAVARGAFQSASLGYWIDHEHTGRGLASRAVAALRTVALNDLGLHRLEASALPHNYGSQRVLLKNGFVRIGMAPNYLEIEGRWQDHNLYQAILHD
ncbi:GNAT family N-acetyltransferase [Glutamicibacter sp.]|uniref:GNAT family N-acetyltransferase n=1 Tax=Glutamicibacter sp. TaxID=1931995 RepID=UPI003D6A141C